MKIKEKNVAVGVVENALDEDGFFVLKIENNSDDYQLFTKDLDATFIQFHFCISGNAVFMFNEGSYSFPIQSDESLLLYNTEKDLPVNLKMAPHSRLISVIISITEFHSLFSKEANFIHFLSNDFKNKKYYSSDPVQPALSVVLNQIFNANLHHTIKDLYVKGKVFELLSLYFNKAEEADIEQCPFLVDEDNVKRIRNAKDIVISRMAEPPSLSELADEVGLSLKKLKEGFKHIYGDSVFSFLFDYKMEFARKMLETGKYNVNEVGLKVGYSTSSHFIAAFKKKYGTTPKKYLMSQTS